MYTLRVVATERRLSQLALPGSERNGPTSSTTPLHDASLGGADSDSDDSSQGELLGLDDDSQAIEFTAGNPRVEHITGVVHLYRPTPGRLPQSTLTPSSSGSTAPLATTASSASSAPRASSLSTLPALADAPPVKGAPTSWASLFTPAPPPEPPPRHHPAGEPCAELCCLALPSDMTIADFCTFLGGHLLRLRRMRVLRRQVGPVGGAGAGHPQLLGGAAAAAPAAPAPAAGAILTSGGTDVGRPRSNSSGGGGSSNSSSGCCSGSGGVCGAVGAERAPGPKPADAALAGTTQGSQQQVLATAGAAAAPDSTTRPCGHSGSNPAATHGSCCGPQPQPAQPSQPATPTPLPSSVPPAAASATASAAARLPAHHARSPPVSQRVVCMVVMHLESPQAAEELYNDLNGRPFSSLEPDVVCRLVFVRQVEVTSGGGGASGALLLGGSVDGKGVTGAAADAPTTAAAAAAATTATAAVAHSPSAPPPGQTELPTCPVCLERLDEHVSGIVTTVCNHMFHSECLQKWADTSCPVCRYCVQGAASTSRCGVCGTAVDLWICLICGHVGCGRYRAGHAADHWRTSGHCYALELETQRVWDYVGDNYVHRLIQSKTDGKLVELAAPAAAFPPPHGGGGAAAAAAGHRHGDDASCGAAGAAAGGAGREYGMDGGGVAGGSGVAGGGGGGGRGPGWSSADEELKEALMASKLDAIAAEYNHLLASQLDSQRQYYEGLLAQAALEADHRCSQAGAAADKARGEAEEAQAAAREEAKRRHAAERKATETAEQLRTVRQEAEFLRSLNETLLANQRDLKQQLADQRARTEAAEATGRELQEQVRDLAFFIEAQRTISDAAGGELREGTVLPLPQGSSGSGQRGAGRSGTGGGSRGSARGGGGGAGGRNAAK